VLPVGGGGAAIIDRCRRLDIGTATLPRIETLTSLEQASDARKQGRALSAPLSGGVRGLGFVPALRQQLALAFVAEDCHRVGVVCLVSAVLLTTAARVGRSGTQRGQEGETMKKRIAAAALWSSALHTARAIIQTATRV
jgi:hypothetical protein